MKSFERNSTSDVISQSPRAINLCCFALRIYQRTYYTKKKKKKENIAKPMLTRVKPMKWESGGKDNESCFIFQSTSDKKGVFYCSTRPLKGILHKTDAGKNENDKANADAREIDEMRVRRDI